MNSAQRKEAAELGVTISEVGFVDPFYAYYDSKLLKRHSPHVPLDRVKKDIAEYQKLGVRILGVYPPTLQGEVWELHPDWRRIATDTDQIPEVDLKKYPHGGMLCPLGPYGDFFIDVLCEIVTQFPAVSAFSFDGLHHAGGCYCKHCRTNYKKDTGISIPKRDMQSEAFRKYLHWADRKLEALVQRMQSRDIEIRLRGYKVKRVKQEPDGQLLEMNRNQGTIRVPKLLVHAMVVAELE